MLSIAHGYDTYKLKFGQHGGNHPVSNNGVVEITAQNHNYNVPDNIVEIADITHINLFDNTIEGVKYKIKRFSLFNITQKLVLDHMNLNISLLNLLRL